MDKPRNERIAEAQAKIVTLQPRHDEIVAEMKMAQAELREAEQSYDVGERVAVEITCRRGCCIENSYVGTVVSRNGKYNYDIQACSEGPLYKNVWKDDMRRVK